MTDRICFLRPNSSRRAFKVDLLQEVSPAQNADRHV